MPNHQPLTQVEFGQYVTAEDDLGAIIRSHLYIETLLNLFLEFTLVRPDALDIARMNYQAKVRLASALGLSEIVTKPLEQLGTLRNSFAHKLNYKLDRKDADQFYSTFGHDGRQITVAAYASSLAKLADPTSKPRDHRKLPPKDRFVLYATNIWSMMQIAVWQVSSRETFMKLFPDSRSRDFEKQPSIVEGPNR